MTDADHLTTGWEADLEPGDSVLRRYLHAWVAQCETFAGSVGGTTQTGSSWALADAGRPTGYFNAATLLAPLPFDDPGSVLGEIEDAVSVGRGEVHLWSAWPTPDLRPRGWELMGHPPLLIRPPASMLGIPEPVAPVEVIRVEDAATLADWERVVIEGYPFPDLLPFHAGSVAGATLIDDDRLRLAIGIHDGVPVSAAAQFVHHGLGLFALAATRPEARGRGHWRAHAIDRLRAAPDVWMAGVFSDFSRPLAEAIGFVPILRLTLWSRPRP